MRIFLLIVYMSQTINALYYNIAKGCTNTMGWQVRLDSFIIYIHFASARARGATTQ